MNIGLIEAVLLAWPPIVAVLFRAIGPRRAVLVGLLGGYLFLPVNQTMLGPSGFAFPLHKFTATGLGLLLGAMIFDGRTLFRARPRWLDLPMAGYYLAPLIGLATGVPGSSLDIVDVLIGRGLGWVVPYAMGRIYFSGGDGPASVAVALVISGLAYIPICIYEEIAGPTRYLAGLIYRQAYNPGMVDRLGGWRPEGFLGDGLSLAAWMALTTVMATWLWLGGWRPGRWPAWPAALALLLVTLSCRGVYGYLILAIGLPSAFLTRWLRTRAILAALIVVPFLYMGLRATGAWDGGLLVQASAFTGREGTVAWRLNAENQVIEQVLGHNPIVGFGNYIWHAKGLTLWPDGGWLHALWMGGLVGLALWVTALHILPAALALSRPTGRPDGRQAASPSWGLACWCILQMIDGLHNTSYASPTALIAGCLVGFSAWKGAEAFERRSAAGRLDAHRKPLPIPLIISVILLICVEILGRFPRTFAPFPADPAPESASAKQQP
jgi:hypothetical protein